MSIASEQSVISPYARSIDGSGADSLSELGRRIAPGSTVLDLGAATGALGRFLGEEKDCTVDGVELDPHAAAKARPAYRRLLELDLETVTLAEHFGSHSYHAIVCADVLEHLRDPGRILDQLAELLAPGGRVLISIPNVAYAGLVADLVAGEFEYRTTGLLDRTHLRFFTRRSLIALLAEHGFGIRDLASLTLAPQRSEFRDRFVDRLPAPVIRAILAQPDALTYQFIVEAVPGEAAGAVAVPTTPWPPQPRFSCQLYWGTEGQDFAETDSVVAGGVVGEEHQAIVFDVPATGRPPRKLRLDPADRPGFLQLHDIRLEGPRGEALWTWDGAPSALAAGTSHELVHFTSPFGASWLATGYDPAIELPVPADALARLAGGGRLTLEMSWPASGDFVVAARVLDEHEKRWAEERHALRADLARLEAALTSEREVAEQVRSALEARVAAESSAREAVTLEAGRLAQEFASVRSQAHAAEQQLTTLWGRLMLVETAPSLRRFIARTRRAIRRRRYEFGVVPGRGVRDAGDGSWHGLTNDPSFELVPRGGRFPISWAVVDFEVARDADAVTRPSLYADRGNGYTEATCIPLPRPRDGHIRSIVLLPHYVQSLRFDPVEQPGTMRVGTLAIREIGRLELALRILVPPLLTLLRNPKRIPTEIRTAIAVVRRSGLQGLKNRLADTGEGQSQYEQWVEQFDTLTDTQRKWILDRVPALPRRPRISVVMPVYETPEPWLRRAIESVLGQLYPEWELCIADDASRKPHVPRVLAEYAARDPRIRVVRRETNGHISEASNSALALATGEFVALLDHDDEFAPHALYVMAETLAAHPNADLLYSDEDKIDTEGRRSDPYFKPEWSPELLASQNYFCHLGVYRTELVRRVGGFRAGFEGSQDYDLVLRCAAETTPERIHHVPHVLYHWRSIEGSTAFRTEAKSYAESASRRALTEHFARRDPRVEVVSGTLPTTYHVRFPLPDPAPLVSIVIPTRDGVAVLQRCIDSLVAKTTYPRFEILVIDNQSREARTLDYFESLRREGHARVLKYDRPFNYSAINNFAVRESAGDVICLLNNDVEIVSPEWLTEMVALAMRPEIGCVGAKLLYPNDTVQHAGVVTGIWGVAAHFLRFLPRDAAGYRAHNQVIRNVSAVTGACLVVRRAVWDQVGGLDEEKLAIAFNDIDFCLKVDAAGFRNVWTPFAELYHYESYSRGPEDTPEKQARFRGEIDAMQARWGERLVNDPYYSPNLSLFSENVEVAWPPRSPRPWRGEEPAGGDEPRRPPA